MEDFLFMTLTEKIEIAKDPNTPQDKLIELSKEHVLLARAVALNKNTPINLLEKLSKHQDSHVRRSVAGNINTPQNILNSLKNDEDKYVRLYAIEKLILNQEELVELSKIKDRYIHAGIAGNTNTPIIILMEILNEYDEYDPHIFNNLASNPNINEIIILSLLDKIESGNTLPIGHILRLLSRLADNPNTPSYILCYIISICESNDNNKIVIEKAKSNKNYVELNLNANDLLFCNKVHKRTYMKFACKMKSSINNVYKTSLAYLLSLDNVCSNHINEIYDFDNECIKFDCLSAGWQEETSLKTCRLAFNLFTGDISWTQDPSKVTPADIFCCPRAPYYIEAIKIRYPQYFSSENKKSNNQDLS